MQRRNSLSAMLIMLIAGLMLISRSFSGSSKPSDGVTYIEGNLGYTYDQRTDTYVASYISRTGGGLRPQKNW